MTRASCGWCGWVKDTTLNNHCVGMVCLFNRYLYTHLPCSCHDTSHSTHTHTRARIIHIYISFSVKSRANVYVYADTRTVHTLYAESVAEYRFTRDLRVFVDWILYILLPQSRLYSISVLRTLHGVLRGGPICILQSGMSRLRRKGCIRRNKSVTKRSRFHIHTQTPVYSFRNNNTVRKDGLQHLIFVITISLYTTVLAIKSLSPPPPTHNPTIDWFRCVSLNVIHIHVLFNQKKNYSFGGLFFSLLVPSVLWRDDAKVMCRRRYICYGAVVNAENRNWV
jgi:hypothetical protein